MHNAEEKIEDHLQEHNIIYENQYGFTTGGKTKHCHYTIDCIPDMTYESKSQKDKSLFYAFIDFKKAYDSINREK